MGNVGAPPGNAGPAPGSVNEAGTEPRANAYTDPRIGATFGKYRVLGVLGHGGMGIVYEGEDASLKRKVAIKFLPDNMRHKTVVVERFMREAQVAGRLSHPNIIAIYDVGEDERGCYMVMELLLPDSARSRLKKKGPYPWKVATRIIADCCAALKVAHAAGVVHRDIKPDNILFSQGGVVKLADFGLVKVLEDELHLTQSGMVCGTPQYMSPEQASNEPMDARSDLYSLGVTYYALLTGQPPFLGPGLPQILISHLKEPVPDPRAIAPDISEPCVRVLMRAMKKKLEERFQSAAEMSAELEAILAGVPHRNGSIFVMEEGRTSATALPILAAGAAELNRALPPALPPVRGAKEAVTQGVSRRSILAFGGLLGALGIGAGAWRLTHVAGSKKSQPVLPAASGQRLPPIKVGVLHSLTGPLAVSERPLADSSMLAIEELNAMGGLLGRQIQPIVLDGKSEITVDSAFNHATEKLLKEENVTVVFGSYGSASRKAIVPCFEAYDRLLFYPAQYEGLEESQNVVYTGATPNQFALPALRFSTEMLHKKRYSIIGTDGLRARAISTILADSMKALGVELVDEHYSRVGEFQFASVIKKIERAKPEMIINMLVGDSNVSFFKELVDAEIGAAELPVLSFVLGENELGQLSSLDLSGHYVAFTRFQPSAVMPPQTFKQRFAKKYGSHRPVTAMMEAAYYGVKLWAAAVQRAGTEDVSRVRLALREKEYDLAEVRIRVDPSNQHAWKLFRMGRIDSQNRIEVIKSEDTPIPPIPFPGPRTRAEWQTFSDQLYEKWGENWANPLKPHLKKEK